MPGQAMPMIGCSWSCGTLRISKMPACLASTRNSTLSLTLVVTVAVTVTSYTLSATGSAASERLMSTCGCACSSRIAGEFGCSSDRSFRYRRWIWNTGFWLSSAMAISQSKQSPLAGMRGLDRQLSPARWGRKPGGGSRRLQEGHQPAALVQRDEVVAAADVGVADEDLRHGAAAGDLHHRLPLVGGQVDTGLVDLVHAALLEQHLGADAVTAHQPGV